jgi:hypothetical protein
MMDSGVNRHTLLVSTNEHDRRFVMSRRSLHSLAGLAGLLLLLGAAVPLLPPPRQAAPAGSACLLLSPNVDDALDVDEARRRLRSPEHVRYRRLAGRILHELGLGRHQVHDAVGEWQGGVENSLLVVLDGRTDPLTLSCAAACFGLAARQKTVLAFYADPAGPDALATLAVPGRSLDEVRRLLDRHGLSERTLLPGEDGWRAVILVPAQRAAALAAVPGVRLHVQAGRGVRLGEPTRDRASERYRQVIRAYQASRPGPPLAALGR